MTTYALCAYCGRPIVCGAATGAAAYGSVHQPCTTGAQVQGNRGMKEPRAVPSKQVVAGSSPAAPTSFQPLPHPPAEPEFQTATNFVHQLCTKTRGLPLYRRIDVWEAVHAWAREAYHQTGERRFLRTARRMTKCAARLLRAAARREPKHREEQP